jgi:hypothetical protein
VKWLGSALAVALAIVCALSFGHQASAQDGDPLIAPDEGAAGGRFQIVGQTGWTPGETVMLEFGFADVAPDSYDGPWYHAREITVLRDGTWSFPIVINEELFPFPLWRPGFIVVRASTGTHAETNTFVYTVGGRRPAGLPPLADLGFGRGAAPDTPLLTAMLFALGIGAMFVMSGALARRGSPHWMQREGPRDA